MNLPDSRYLTEHVKASLEEDLGGGDVTTRQTVKKDLRGEAGAFSREEGVIAGRYLVDKVFLLLPEVDKNFKNHPVDINWLVSDGEKVEEGQKLFEIEGNVRRLLAGERVALNYLQQLSGVATRTYQMVKVAQKFGVKIFDTRKTVPHHRLLQKYAITCGRGSNHRLKLDEVVMIKDNHKLAAGGLKEALERLQGDYPVVVEIHSPAELDIISDFDIDVVMLDNMTPAVVKKVVSDLPEELPVEISGGITLDNLEQYCRTGVDRISVGSLTHSFSSLDISMGLIENGR